MSKAPYSSHEALRQLQLMRALWRREDTAKLAAWAREAGDHAALGVAAYRGNAAAVADRALAQAFPTVRQLVGDESFAIMAQAFWYWCPPLHGDLAQWGAELPAFIAADEQLASEPYLADVARVDWAVQRIEQAADVGDPPQGLERLAAVDPDRIGLVLRPGMKAMRSTWPVASIWRAHRSNEVDRFSSARERLEQGIAEDVLVWREGWRGVADAITPAQFAFVDALLGGSSLGAALHRAGAAFSFEQWLHDALARQWLVAVAELT